MEDVYSFVDIAQDLPNKIRHLEDIIAKIVAQTIECVIFIREYTGHGFACKYHCHYHTGELLSQVSPSHETDHIKHESDDIRPCKCTAGSQECLYLGCRSADG